MRSLRTLMAGAALATALVAVAPSAAQAAPAPDPVTPSSAPTPLTASGPEASGWVVGYYDNAMQQMCGWWSGSSYNWGDCWNRALGVYNDRYPGYNDDIWVHWGLNCQKARRGIYNGVALNNLWNWTFDPGTGEGAGESLYKNIASHCVTNLP